MTAAWAPHAPASTSQAGPAGAVTDHSDCSGTAGIASLSIIDYWLSDEGRTTLRQAPRTVKPARSARAQTWPPFPAPGDVRDSPQSRRRRRATRAPRPQAQRRVSGSAWGARCDLRLLGPQ